MSIGNLARISFSLVFSFLIETKAYHLNFTEIILFIYKNFYLFTSTNTSEMFLYVILLDAMMENITNCQWGRSNAVQCLLDLTVWRFIWYDVAILFKFWSNFRFFGVKIRIISIGISKVHRTTQKTSTKTHQSPLELPSFTTITKSSSLRGLSVFSRKRQENQRNDKEQTASNN